MIIFIWPLFQVVQSFAVKLGRKFRIIPPINLNALDPWIVNKTKPFFDRRIWASLVLRHPKLSAPSLTFLTQDRNQCLPCNLIDRLRLCQPCQTYSRVPLPSWRMSASYQNLVLPTSPERPPHQRTHLSASGEFYINRCHYPLVVQVELMSVASWCRHWMNDFLCQQGQAHGR